MVIVNDSTKFAMRKNLNKSHEDWCKKFQKTKSGKIFDLIHKVKSYNLSLKSYDKLDHLSYALSIMGKGTKYEEDIRDLIAQINPKYSSDENS